MYVVSFYSYKGGVGRTMTLLNVAWQLADDGHRVALLDLDLEAPGLHHARLKLVGEECERAPVESGFCEYVSQVKRSKPPGPLPREDVWSHVTTGLGPEGRISIIAACGDRHQSLYTEWVQQFSWRRFYQRHEGARHMERLIEVLGQPPDARAHDYLLIDGRTGHTDVASITLRHLPDAIVFVTNLSEQSVEGITQQTAYLQNFNHSLEHDDQPEMHMIRRAGVGRKPIRYLLVASQLPHGEWTRRQKAIESLTERALQAPDVEIDHLPALALDESVQIVAPHLQLDLKAARLPAPLRPYREIVDRLYRMNVDSPESLLGTGRALLEVRRWREARIHFRQALKRARESGLKRVEFEAEHAALRSLLHGLDWAPAKDVLDKAARHWRMDPRDAARLELHASWTPLVIDELDDSLKRLEQALAHVEKSPENESSDVDGVFIRYFLGSTYSLLDNWGKSEMVLSRAAQDATRLGEVPLLEGMIAAERARALTALGRWNEAGELLQAWLTNDRRRHLIEPSIVLGELLLSRAQLRFFTGHLSDASDDEGKARTLFIDERDRISLVEAALLHANLHGCLPPAPPNEADTQNYWISVTEELDLVRVRERIFALEQAWQRGLGDAAFGFVKQHDSWELQGQACLDVLRLKMFGRDVEKPEALTRCAEWLAADDKLGKVEVYRQAVRAEVVAFMALATVDDATRRDVPPDHPGLPAITRVRLAVARAIVRLADKPDDSRVAPELLREVKMLLPQEPARWDGAKALAFLSHVAEGTKLRCGWERVRAALSALT